MRENIKEYDISLNMSILKYFFDVKSNKSLFNGLNISKEKKICKKHRNQYLVIYISLKDCKEGMKQIEKRYSREEETKTLVKKGDEVLFFSIEKENIKI